MVTCFLKYTIDPYKVAAFEHYGKLWIDLVNEMGGVHHGYLLPYEGANNIGYATFSFATLADYEDYRNKIPSCPKCMEAFEYAKNTGCILHYERSFLKPVFEGINDKARID
ncbi:NIPSNAP family protein [Limibacter armeniacum]|uniref:NIPSNAP family protein n=1 Tax=Limibacter armeniacum TaxID=466084 RepID=UPI002FE5473A